MENICSTKDKILSAITNFENMKDILTSENKIANIVVEETVFEEWATIKKNLAQLTIALPSLHNRVIWRIKSLQDFLLFVENELHLVTSPCKFVTFLQKISTREDVDRNIKFIKWVFKNDTRCARAFKKI